MEGVNLYERGVGVYIVYILPLKLHLKTIRKVFENVKDLSAIEQFRHKRSE